jgi:predicted RNase H-like HicB family nuclease
MDASITTPSTLHDLFVREFRFCRFRASPYNGSVKFRVVLEYDPVAQSYPAVCPELPGCTSAGDTELEARENIEQAIHLYLSPSELDLPANAKLLEVMVG